MRSVGISYGYTKNKGNFESERCEARIEFDLGKDQGIEEGLQRAFSQAKAFVQSRLDIEEEEIIRPKTRRNSQGQVLK